LPAGRYEIDALFRPGDPQETSRPTRRMSTARKHLTGPPTSPHGLRVVPVRAEYHVAGRSIMDSLHSPSASAAIRSVRTPYSLPATGTHPARPWTRAAPTGCSRRPPRSVSVRPSLEHRDPDATEEVTPCATPCPTSRAAHRRTTAAMQRPPSAARSGRDHQPVSEQALCSVTPGSTPPKKGQPGASDRL